MKEYLKAQNKTNETILGNTYSPDELDRFSRSDYRWADNRTKPFRHKKAKKGEIYQFEFGKNYNHDFEQYLQTAASLSEQLKKALNRNNILEAENERLKAELKILQNQLPASRTD